MLDQAFSYGEAKALSANAFSKSGYTFFGWSISSAAVRKYTNAQTVKDISGGSDTVDLYAIWTVSDIANGIDCTAYPWITDSKNAWYRTTATKIGYCSLSPHDGTDMVMSSGASGGEADSWIQTTVTGPATCSFYYATYSYSGSKFQIYVDGSRTANISCEASDHPSWVYKSVSVAAGVHTIKLNYHHVNGWTGGGNGVRVDQFVVK